MESITSPAQWLKHEDKGCYSDRLRRLHWLAHASQELGDVFLPAGIVSKYLFEEARYCFAYGQFWATIMLGMAFIEQCLAAKFYASGRDDLERADASILIEEAFQQRLVSQPEYEVLHRIRHLRNPLTHFRKPLHNESIERRSVEANDYPYAVIEQDAKTVLQIMFELLRSRALQFP